MVCAMNDSPEEAGAVFRCSGCGQRYLCVRALPLGFLLILCGFILCAASTHAQISPGPLSKARTNPSTAPRSATPATN